MNTTLLVRLGWMASTGKCYGRRFPLAAPTLAVPLSSGVALVWGVHADRFAIAMDSLTRIMLIGWHMVWIFQPDQAFGCFARLRFR